MLICGFLEILLLHLAVQPWLSLGLLDNQLKLVVRFLNKILEIHRNKIQEIPHTFYFSHKNLQSYGISSFCETALSKGRRNVVYEACHWLRLYYFHGLVFHELFKDSLYTLLFNGD
jgi:hypothetical protein